MSLPDETKSKMKLQLAGSIIREPVNDIYGVMFGNDAYQILSDDANVIAPIDFLDTSSYNWGVIETINNSITNFIGNTDFWDSI